MKTITVGSLGKIITGKTPPTNDKDNYGGDIPFITPVDMIGNRNAFITERYISKKGLNTVKNCFLPEHSICVSCIGSDMGKSVMTVKPSVTNQQINSIIVDENSFDYLYVYYLMRTLEEKIKSLGKNATAVPILNKTKFSNIEISIFEDIERQKAISSILSAYDDLIENNQKQIKLLEEAAQRLYKEWFVDLRFPGYENTPIVDGVPEGWEKVPLSELISYEIGGGWGEEYPTAKNTKKAYVIRGTDLYGITHGDLLSIPFRFHAESNLLPRNLIDGDIVFEVSGGSRTEGVARCLLITSAMLEAWKNNVMCASFCKLIRPKNGCSYYLHDCFKYMRSTGKTEEYDKRSASSIVNYRWKDFLAQEVLLKPTAEMLDRYNSFANGLYSKVISCSLQIESAKKARDRLLPKLMNGEIEV